MDLSRFVPDVQMRSQRFTRWLNRESEEIIFEEPVLVYSFIDPVPFEARVGELIDFIR